MNKNQKDLHLLPPKFKKIALGIILASILAVVFSKLKIIALNKDVVGTVSMSGFLIGLLLLAITSDKIEDELTLRIRLKAFAASFISGVIMVVVEPFINFLFDGNFSIESNSTKLLITMLFFYFFMLFVMKRNR